MDLWDRLDTGSYYRTLPADSVEEMLGGEVRTLHIGRDAGSWEIYDQPNGSLVSDGHATLEDAKKAGDDHIAHLEASQAAGMLKSAGLDPREWAFTQSDAGPTFVLMDGAGDRWVWAHRSRETLSTAWRAAHYPEGADSFEPGIDFATATEAAASLPRVAVAVHP